MRSDRPQATSTPSWVTTVSTSWTLRPGRTTRLATVTGAVATGRSSSRVSRVSVRPSSPASCSTDRATTAATGPPCSDSGDHGPRARSVGTRRSPSGSKREVTPAPCRCSSMGATLPVVGAPGRAYHRVASGPAADRRRPTDRRRRSTMGQRTAEIDIDGTPEAVWALAGDFGGIAGWMPGMESCRVEGDNRILDTMGMTITEQLVSKDDAARDHHLRHRRRRARRVARGHRHRDRVGRRQPRHLGGRRHPRRDGRPHAVRLPAVARGAQGPRGGMTGRPGRTGPGPVGRPTSTGSRRGPRRRSRWCGRSLGEARRVARVVVPDRLGPRARGVARPRRGRRRPAVHPVRGRLPGGGRGLGPAPPPRLPDPERVPGARLPGRRHPGGRRARDPHRVGRAPIDPKWPGHRTRCCRPSCRG